MITKLIKKEIEGWIDSGEINTSKDVNNGLCADFAHSITEKIEGAKVFGIYDMEDIDYAKSNHKFSKKFKKAVSNELIGHSCIYFNNKYYDSESPEGVSSFEKLKINQRALKEIMSKNKKTR